MSWDDSALLNLVIPTIVKSLEIMPTILKSSQQVNVTW